MILLTREDEQRLRERLRSTLMLAEIREALEKTADAIAEARAMGARYVHVRIDGANLPPIKLA
jgi:hypothetical protein